MEAPTRVHLSYFDQNEAFAQAFPKTGLSGSVVRRVALRDWGDNWALLALDSPFEYLGRRHDQLLIKSRWQGYEVGGTEKTSVFILLLPNQTVLDKSVLDSKDFEHVAWGMASTLAVP
jgi:hypothetical protein